MNLNLLLQALDLQQDAARALTDNLRTQIDTLQTQLREAELRLEHLAITRTTITGLADRIPALQEVWSCPSTRTTRACSPSSTAPPAP
ncbi:hypothetical protein [Streptomyces sp. IBSBF 3010]|uniref:hypothetical protein n=1 Tax=Streptomyces sp. IBSBF 3010 TaxID=2903526 RepID=UPI002FDC124B